MDGISLTPRTLLRADLPGSKAVLESRDPPCAPFVARTRTPALVCDGIPVFRTLHFFFAKPRHMSVLSAP